MSAAALLSSNEHEKARIHTLIRRASNDATLDFLMAGHSIGEQYSFKIKPGFPTACWAYLPPHQIYIGDGIPAKAKPDLTDDEMVEYFKKYAFHELSHLLWTERDLESINEDLKSMDVPFSLFNLFEDARIEHRYRNGASIFFEWVKYEPVKLENKPAAIFFALVQHEGDLEPVRAGVLSSLQEPSAEDLLAANQLIDDVDSFYRRARDDASSRALYPILKEWCLIYPPEKSFIPSRGNETEGAEGTPDLTPMLEGQTKEEAAQLFDAGSFGVNEPPPGKSLGGRKVAEPKGVVPDGGNADLLSDEPSDIDNSRVSLLASRLGALFLSQSRLVTSEVPGKKISVRHFVSGRPYYRHRVLESLSRKKVLFVVDCSGSMSSRSASTNNVPIEEGRLMVAALSVLASRGIVSGHIVLSAVCGRKTVWQRFALPMKLESIQRIHAFGGAEGLESAIRNNLKLAQAADFVFVYTDASICDEPIDKSRLHLKGVYTWGLYVGGEEALEELKKYFDKSLIRSTAEKLVEAILTQR
jgi:hypothetical protein